MFRFPKPALTLFAGLVMVMASACSSGGATTAPGGSGGGNNAPGSSPTVNSQDASSIITGVINGGTAVKSFHIKLAVSGTIKAAALDDPTITSDLKLDGTAIEGDVDVANAAAHLTFNVAAMAPLGNVPVTGDLIVANSTLFYKIAPATKYAKMDLGSLTSMSPIAVPTAGASALAGVTDEITKLRSQLDAAGVKATLVGVEQVDGKDAYHITVSGLPDYLNTQIAAAASAGTAMKIDSAAVDIWIYKDSNDFAKLEVKGASSSIGNIDVTLTVTAYNQPVTVTAPAAKDITP